MTKPSICCSRYTTIRCFPSAISRTAMSSPCLPATMRDGSASVSSTSCRMPANSQCSSVMWAQRSEVNRTRTPPLLRTDSAMTFHRQRLSAGCSTHQRTMLIRIIAHVHPGIAVQVAKILPCSRASRQCLAVLGGSGGTYCGQNMAPAIESSGLTGAGGQWAPAGSVGAGCQTTLFPHSPHHPKPRPAAGAYCMLNHSGDLLVL